MNDTTRENIANVYGAKTLTALVPLELTLHLVPTTATQQNEQSRIVRMLGHISRPVFGEGRQAPDRQMFFVNSRPCLLPQVAKAVNEVYRSFNVSQSPFVCANLVMDTNAYDVNVSPDKRTILLHDQTALLEELKEELEKMFQVQDQTVPQAKKPSVPSSKLPSFRSLTLPQSHSNGGDQTQIVADGSDGESDSSRVPALGKPHKAADEQSVQSDDEDSLFVNSPRDVLRRFVTKDTEERQPFRKKPVSHSRGISSIADDGNLANGLPGFRSAASLATEQPLATINGDQVDPVASKKQTGHDERGAPLRSTPMETPQRLRTEDPHSSGRLQVNQDTPIPAIQSTPARATPGPIQSAFDRMRMRRTSPTTAIVTIGDTTTVTDIGSAKRRKIHTPRFNLDGNRLSQGSPSIRNGLSRFAAGGTTINPAENESASEDSAEESSDAEPEPRNSNAGSNERQRRRIDEETEATALTDTEEHPSASRNEGSDDEYVDEAEKKSAEEARVARLIAKAEEQAAKPSQDNLKRAQSVLSGRIRRHATYQLVTDLDTASLDLEALQSKLASLRTTEATVLPTQSDMQGSKSSAGEQLTLTVSKQDFFEMRIAGQFNLGFILAVRRSKAPVNEATSPTQQNGADELFIIDQHASDEKYNFERLQNETIVQNQKLVQPKVLDLTAVEEEIILNNSDALLKNGFVINVDESGDSPTGQRCKLISLPMSKEVVFDIRDLEELLALLSETAGSGVPRPSKVRRMFAMRACRGSIMVGKTLTLNQMEKVVRHMGQIDKPWNCPHGRPTMRHVFGLQDWKSWDEDDGLDEQSDLQRDRWAQFLKTDDEIG